MVKAGTVGQITYARASSKDVATFSPASKASAGLPTGSSVSKLRVDGVDVGAVAVYTLKPGSGKSVAFQDQYVVQLVNALSRGNASPKFVKVDGHVVALATGKKAVAGWFADDKVVLLYRTGKTPDLTSLAAAVRARLLNS